MIKKIVTQRRLIQVGFAALVYFVVSYFKINLLYVILFGSALGIIFGKVFCRWMCPIGLFMEFMMGRGQNRNMQLYSYYKMGCPIAWVSGFLNKFSLFKIKKDDSLCINCGKCDKACYISSLNSDFSLYKTNKENPSRHYSCSKCLECVKDCPVNSLSYDIGT